METGYSLFSDIFYISNLVESVCHLLRFILYLSRQSILYRKSVNSIACLFQNPSRAFRYSECTVLLFIIQLVFSSFSYQGVQLSEGGGALCAGNAVALLVFGHNRSKHCLVLANLVLRCVILYLKCAKSPTTISICQFKKIYGAIHLDPGAGGRKGTKKKN